MYKCYICKELVNEDDIIRIINNRGARTPIFGMRIEPDEYIDICPYCKSEIYTEDIYEQCQECGKEFLFESLTEKELEMYCKECRKKGEQNENLH